MENEKIEISLFQRIFNLIGWLGFVCLIPVGLSLFGKPEFQTALLEKLGPMASEAWLVLYFLSCQLLRVVFGSSRLLTPLILGLLSSAVILSAVLPLGFMEWLYKALEPFGFFAHKPLAFAVSLLLLILAYLLSFVRHCPWFIQVLLLVILPLGGIIALELAGINTQFAGLTGLK